MLIEVPEIYKVNSKNDVTHRWIMDYFFEIPNLYVYKWHIYKMMNYSRTSRKILNYL